MKIVPAQKCGEIFIHSFMRNFVHSNISDSPLNNHDENKLETEKQDVVESRTLPPQPGESASEVDLSEHYFN